MIRWITACGCRGVDRRPADWCDEHRCVMPRCRHVRAYQSGFCMHHRIAAVDS